MSIGSVSIPLSPDAKSIDAWLSLQPRNTDGSIDGHGNHFLVNVWTKGGSCRCITSSSCRQEHDGVVWYETIRSEGNSSAGHFFEVQAAKIVRAVGVFIGDVA